MDTVIEKRVVLCDVDGTLANNEHRQHFLDVKPKDWKNFKYNAFYDPPYPDIVWLVRTLHAAGNKILIVTARTEDEREVTTRWLDEVAGIGGLYERMYMREDGDYRDDTIVKAEILETIRKDGYDPTLVLDDRNRVVKMWRDLGITCLHVRDGNF
jgi:phosphoglycolate phosphatase-like HAD superfamily hydrolase